MRSTSSSQPCWGSWETVPPVHRHRRLHCLRVLKANPRCNQKTAIQFLDYLLAKLPFRVEVIQTDVHTEWRLGRAVVVQLAA